MNILFVMIVIYDYSIIICVIIVHIIIIIYCEMKLILTCERYILERFISFKNKELH